MFNAPIDVILSAHDVVQPDLVVVTEPSQISSRGIEGLPALLVEVLSPSSRQTDRSAKAKRYAALGCPHYWIVDPDGRRVDCYRVADHKYTPVVEAEGNATLAHPDWPGLTIDLAMLWRSVT